MSLSPEKFARVVRWAAMLAAALGIGAMRALLFPAGGIVYLVSALATCALMILLARWIIARRYARDDRD